MLLVEEQPNDLHGLALEVWEILVALRFAIAVQGMV